MIEQAELKGLKVKMDPVGRAAKKYLKSLEAEKEAKDARLDAGTDLVRKMIKASRMSILVDGTKVSVQHVEASDLIKVKKAKDK